MSNPNQAFKSFWQCFSLIHSHIPYLLIQREWLFKAVFIFLKSPIMLFLYHPQHQATAFQKKKNPSINQRGNFSICLIFFASPQRSSIYTHSCLLSICVRLPGVYNPTSSHSFQALVASFIYFFYHDLPYLHEFFSPQLSPIIKHFNTYPWPTPFSCISAFTNSVALPVSNFSLF